MSSNEIIEFQNVFKTYSNNFGPLRLKNFLDRVKNGQLFTKTVEDEGFTALKNISFSIHKGERVGVIGHNGAGKSTLLRLLSGVASPTQGDISIDGEVGGVLDLGAGFHPELTARDNIFLQGAIYGFAPEQIKEMIDPIMQICELRQFIDVPLKKYSSGMKVRLGFAIAMTTTPDIVLLDEVLAVGDMAFRKKSLEMMNQFLSNRTMIFVSHSLTEVEKVCDRTFVINQGELLFDGDVKEGVIFYRDLVEKGKNVTKVTKKVIASNLVRGAPSEPQIEATNLAIEPYRSDGTTHKVTFRLTSKAKSTGDCICKLGVRKMVLNGISDHFFTCKIPVKVASAATQTVEATLYLAALIEGDYILTIAPEFSNRAAKTGVIVSELPFKLDKQPSTLMNTDGLINLRPRLLPSVGPD